MVTLWDVLLNETDIEPENPPPEMSSDMELLPMLPDAVPDALNVRSSQSPDARLPEILSVLRIWIGFLSLLHWMAMPNSLPPPE